MNPASLVGWIESRDLPATALTVAAAVLIADLAWAYLDRAKPDADNEDAVKVHAQHRRARFVVGGTAGSIAFTVLLIWGPWWIEGHHLRDKNHELVSSAGIIITGFRTMLIALAAGGFTAAGLYYTREKHRLERDQFKHTQEQFTENQKQFETILRETQQRDQEQVELAREGQVTGRYVEAIKLMASKELAERLGGIYALERIMKDSEKDHEAIVEVLAAFIRLMPKEDRTGQPEARIRDDAQAALSVLGRRPERPERIRIDLSGANLKHANLERACLSRADFSNADLSNARADGANFDKAYCVKANLTHILLRDASVQEVNFLGSNLTQAKLSRTDLRKSGFITAKLQSTNLEGSNLIGAVYLTVDMLLDCNITERTQLPDRLASDPEIQHRQS
ncbi:pentapeptide repeat-containing protein [Streptomyces sp. NPDC048484]|uniref:pentapeptide repeat-containing protein n=1 Tax=Streptomyces sp. NPDC048484 TaxID=3155146 RepID=UPI003416AF30